MTSPQVRFLLVAAAVAATLASCNRREAEEAPPVPAVEIPAEVTPADAAAPLAYESKNQFAEVRLTLPDTVKAYPDLHARLYSTGVRTLREFSEGAQSDRTEFGDQDQLPPYSRTIDWSAAGQTGKLVSFRRLDSDYSGGAHPNAAFGSTLWDKALRRAVEPRQLFRRGADLTVLDRALCEAINVAKKARDPEATPVTLGDTTGTACPRAADTPFVLSPSTTPGKAGGLIFLIAPYLVGPYAEGSYEIAIPQSAFRALIAPEYADEFAGAPPRAGDVTPAN
jgi:hypothetical protein